MGAHVPIGQTNGANVNERFFKSCSLKAVLYNAIINRLLSTIDSHGAIFPARGLKAVP